MASERQPFRNDIEGIRGLAILLVVAFHANVAALNGGYVGVDVFFVLSGFLITGLLIRELERSGGIDLGAFYASRVQRLLPAFLVVVLATLGLIVWLYAPIDQPSIASDARAVALHYANLLFAGTSVDYYSTADNPFLHTWSLAVEEQFYLVWPLLFAVLARLNPGEAVRPRRAALAMGVVGAASFGASLWITSVAQHWAFFGMPTRIWEFAIGGLTAVALSASGIATGRGTWLQAAGLAAIGYAALSYHSALPYPGSAALLPTLGTAALLVGGQRAPAGRLSRALELPPLRWLGRISYSWYLWHWPLVGVGAVMDWKIGAGGRLLWSVFALVPATLTYRFIEEPARRARWTAWPSHRVNLVAVGASIGVALLASVAMIAAQRRASTPIQRAIAAARTDGMRHDCWGSLRRNASGRCIFGDTTSRTTVALLGDSHAEHWLPAMDLIGRERHWKIVAMVKPGCPVADMPELVNARLKRVYSECTDWRRAMLRRIVAMRPDAVVLSSWDHYMPTSGEGSPWQVTPAMWRAGLTRTYRQLASAGLRTVVIRGTPRPGFDVPACLSRRAAGTPFQLRDCVYDRAESLSPRLVAAQNDAARGLRAIAFVDMNDRFCSGSSCAVVQRGSIVFRDDGHLTATFSRAEAPVLGDRIARALASVR